MIRRAMALPKILVVAALAFTGCARKSGDPSPAGATLFGRMAGLWSGAAGQTPLGSFAMMNMDFRAADANWLFGRVDLDSGNSLRYGFTVEDLGGGKPGVVYRNGGYFQNTLRDMTLELLDADDEAGSYHFCAVANGCMYVNGVCVNEVGGCGFVDAQLTFSGADQLVFNAHVNGSEHLVWTAARKETATLPGAFPGGPLPTTAAWPTLPSLSVEVTWPQPLSKATNVWVILAGSSCATFTCSPERSQYASAASGATQVTLQFDQIFPGSYYAVALVDSAGTFQTTLAPASGDGVSDPSATVTVPDTGAGSASLPIVYTIP